MDQNKNRIPEPHQIISALGVFLTENKKVADELAGRISQDKEYDLSRQHLIRALVIQGKKR